MDEKSVEFITYFIYWKTILEMMTGNVVISEVDAFACVVLSKAERHLFYGELVGTRERITSYLRCRTNRGRYNRVHLYLHFYYNRSFALEQCLRSVYLLIKLRGFENKLNSQTNKTQI
jgi:hypothetical protein